MSHIFENINATLNPEQRIGAETLYGPVMVIAGAGAGKTRTLIHRAATLIQAGVSPLAILIVTFTNKAAAEITERLGEMIGENAAFITAGTFHSIVLHEILMKYGDSPYIKNELNIDTEQLTILDDKDAKKLLKESMESLPPAQLTVVEENEWNIQDIENEMSLARSKGYTVQEYLYRSQQASTDVLFERLTAAVWGEYNNRCRSVNGIDFDDILVFCAHLLEREVSVAKELADRFRFIMLDEYQDTNPVQMRLMDAIAKQHEDKPNTFVVGDEKQAIYGFRGSDVKVILGFLDRYQDVQVISMTRNYRSNPKIIECANAIASAMNQRVPNSDGQLIAESKIPPKEPLFLEFKDAKDEAKEIASRIQKNLRDGVPGKDIAVLYRNRNIKADLERQLIELDIPYTLVGDTAFFQKAEVKDVVALFKFIFCPWDSMAGLRVLSRIKIGVSEKKARAAMQADGLTVYDFLKLESEKRLKSTKGGEAPYAKSAIKARAFIRPIDMVRESYEYFDSPDDIANFIAQVIETFYVPNLEKSKSKDKEDTANNRLENITYLIERVRDSLKSGLTIEECLEELSLMVQASPELDREMDNKVRLMTMHASKGAEFQHCYVMGCDSNALSAEPDDDWNEIEENRRLLYVAVTRAMNSLCISWSKERIIFGQYTQLLRSPFIEEILHRCNYSVISDDDWSDEPLF